jgi:hypothetical protein
MVNQRIRDAYKAGFKLGIKSFNMKLYESYKRLPINNQVRIEAETLYHSYIALNVIRKSVSNLLKSVNLLDLDSSSKKEIDDFYDEVDKANSSLLREYSFYDDFADGFDHLSMTDVSSGSSDYAEEALMSFETFLSNSSRGLKAIESDLYKVQKKIHSELIKLDL